MAELTQQLRLDRCPYCSVARPVLDTIFGPIQTRDHAGTHRGHWRAYRCTTCGGIVIAASFLSDGGEVHEVHPAQRDVDGELPERAKSYMQQALQSVVAPDGAVMLAASAVDAMLKDKGYREGTLYARIEQAKNDHLITQGMAEWAHAVRLDANNPRHADDDTPHATMQDAQRSIEFASALGQFLFVLPARIQRGLDEAAEPDQT